MLAHVTTRTSDHAKDAWPTTGELISVAEPG